MNIDTELEAWRRDWRTDAAVPPDLRQRVERQTRWLKVGLAGDILVTVVIGGGMVALAARSQAPDMIVLAAATLLFIAAAWGFRLAATRGLWSPSAMDAAAFADLWMRRCRAQMKATVFGAVLFAVEVAFCMGWIYRHSGGGKPLAEWLFSSAVHWAVWTASLVFFLGLAWYRRRKRAEMQWLAAHYADGR